MKGVCIKTNGIKSKVRTPSNLKNECVVKVDSLKLLGLDQTASKQVLSPEEKDIKARLEKLGVHYCSDEAFYAAHKISRVDFINKVSELPEEQQQAEVLKLFDDRSTKGRKIDLSRIEKNIKKALEKTSGKATKTVYGLNNL
uniref:Uncharacterized protein n=1 Tax=Euplotes harpa TaxID=151035 RepID=A0A7S3N3W7_9SPIT|mmetsp:Transcript_18655/g.21433  ORF Transcript_18655/g.21433 Transcript_18655/m.21433 type:complete len:142 (+) Transcript_18655:664-1089(+)